MAGMRKGATADQDGRWARWRGFVVGGGITVFWLVMMFTLVRDKIIPQQREEALAAQAITPDVLTKNWRDSEELMVVKLGVANLASKDVGFAATSVRRVMDGRVASYVADFRMSCGINLVGLMRNITIQARGELDDKFDLSKFYIVADLAAFKVEVTGAASADEMWVEVRSKDQVHRARYQLERKISLLDAVRPVATRNFEIKPGNKVAFPVVDPVLSMEQGTMELSVQKPEKITVDGVAVTAFPVIMRLNDFKSKSWVDKDGTTLKRELAGGFVMERASEARRKHPPADLPKEVQIPALNAADFAGLKAQPLRRLGAGEKSPLDALSGLGGK